MADQWDQFPDAPKSAAADPWASFPDAKPSAPTSEGSLSRGVGLTIGAAAEGVNDLGNAPANIISLADRGAIAIRSRLRAIMGLPPENLTPVSAPQGPQTGAAQLGLPSASTPGEQLYTSAVRGGTGAALGGAGAGASGANIARMGASGFTGGASADLARQAGAGPVGQFAAGAVGGSLPAIAEGAAVSTARGVGNALRPLRPTGQQDMAAQTLQRQATNPALATQNLQNAHPIVPGSPRTMGEASGDPGLLALEKGIRGRNTGDFGERLSQQNTARQKALQGLAGTGADVVGAQEARNAETSAMRSEALDNAGTSNIRPVLQKIDGILDSPVGKRDIPSQALNWLKAKLSQVDDTSDRFMTPSQVAKEGRGTFETRDPANLYAIRQDINDAIAGKLGGEEAKYRLAQSQLIDVRGALDDAIEKAAPGFKAYLQRYSELSKPIDQMKAMQEIERRANLTTADVSSGQPFLGAAGFSRALDDALSEGKLTSDQIQQLKAIKTDLQYGQAINGPLVKAPGSDTFQNLSIAQVIGAGPSPTQAVMKTLAKPLSWIYKAADSDGRVNDLLKQAALDPKFAAALLRRATPQSTYQLSEALKRALKTGGAGAGVAAPTMSPQAQTSSAGSL